MKTSILLLFSTLFLRFCSLEDGEDKALSNKIYYLQGYPGNLYRVNADGSGDQQLTTEGDYGNLDVTADGKRMVYASSAGDNWNIYMANIDQNGISDKKVIYGGDYRDEDCKFSPDGSKIIFKSNQWGIELYQTRNVYDLLVLDIATSKVTKLTSHSNAEAWAPVFSPDGKKIAFVLRQSDQGAASDEIYTIGVDGTDLRRITNNTYADWFPSFTRNGDLIYVSQKVADCDDDLYEIPRAALNGPNPESKAKVLKVNACSSISDADPYASKTDENHLAFVSTRDGGYGIYVGHKQSGMVHKVIGKQGFDLLGPILSK